MRNISVSIVRTWKGVAIISLSFVIELTNWLRSAASLSNKYQGAGLDQMTEAELGGPMEVSHHPAPHHSRQKNHNQNGGGNHLTESFNEYN